MMYEKIEFYNRYLDIVNYEKYIRTSIDRKKWTQEKFGTPGVGRDWFIRSYAIPTDLGINDLKEVYYFKHPKDATFFSLRWS